jgi:hypothetical protein
MCYCDQTCVLDPALSRKSSVVPSKESGISPQLKDMISNHLAATTTNANSTAARAFVSSIAEVLLANGADTEDTIVILDDAIREATVRGLSL